MTRVKRKQIAEQLIRNAAQTSSYSMKLIITYLLDKKYSIGLGYMQKYAHNMLWKFLFLGNKLFCNLQYCGLLLNNIKGIDRKLQILGVTYCQNHNFLLF